MMKGRFSRVTLALAAVTLATSAKAADCDRAYSKLLHEAQTSGDSALVKLLEGLQPVPLRDEHDATYCDVRLTADIVAQGFESTDPGSDGVYLKLYYGRGDYRPGDGLPARVYVEPRTRRTRRDDPPQVESDRERLYDNDRAVLIHRLERATFSGVHIGQSLQSAFDALLAAGFTSDATDPKEYPFLYRKAYRFAVNCAHNNYALRDHSLNMCNIEAGKFRRVDQNGTRYQVSISMTDIDSPLREPALAEGKIWVIDANVAVKGDVGQSYYQKLGLERYGDLANSKLPFEPPSKYPVTRENWELDCTCLNITASADSIEFWFHSQILYEHSRDALIDSLLRNEGKRADTAPKPTF